MEFMLNNSSSSKIIAGLFPFNGQCVVEHRDASEFPCFGFRWVATDTSAWDFVSLLALHVLAGLGFVVGDDKAPHEWTVGVGMEWWYVDIVQEKTRVGEIRLATCDGRRE
jgi:hypothetical protein